MRHLKIWENFDTMTANKVYTLSELRVMSKWLEDIWDKLENKNHNFIINFFEKIEEEFGENVANIIDGMYSADKLHYHQSGRTSLMGGTNTSQFIKNFETIRDTVESFL